MVRLLTSKLLTASEVDMRAKSSYRVPSIRRELRLLHPTFRIRRSADRGRPAFCEQLPRAS
jgi:hypothetical protein